LFISNTVAYRIYPSIETYRVFTLDIHKTKNLFHTNVTISDGTTLKPTDKGTKKGKWIFRDHLNTHVSADGWKYGLETDTIASRTALLLTRT